MKHFASPAVWQHYGKLPANIREIADKNLKLLRQDFSHPSLHLKKVSRYWSVRVGKSYRTLAVQTKKDSSGLGSALTPNMINWSDPKTRKNRKFSLIRYSSFHPYYFLKPTPAKPEMKIEDLWFRSLRLFNLNR